MKNIDDIRRNNFINKRYIFFVAISLILGAIFSYKFFAAILGNGKIKWIVYFVLVSFALILLCIFSFIKIRYKFFVILNYYKTSFLVCLISFMFAVIFIMGYCLYYNNLKDTYSDVTISATIENVTQKENYTKVDLRKIKVTENNITSLKNFNGTLYLFGNQEEYEEGDNVLFVGDLTKYDLFNTREVSNYVNKNYYEITSDEVVVLDNSKKLSDKFKLKCFDLLTKNMNEENAEICYASLFGDKSKLESDVRNSFSTIGIAHLLAVSGLHVGLIALMLTFILNFIKHKNLLKVILFSFVLFLYAYLCGFSPSVTRAVVMSIILFSADLYQVKYDSINSLSLSFIICFLFLNPLSIFTIGMQLSFLCVLGIITFQKRVLNLIFKRKPYDKKSKTPPPRAPKILESLAMSISVNFIILPVYITSFNKISIFTVFINLFFIPLFSLSFSIMFVSLLITLIFPFLDFILVFPNSLFQIIKVVANFISNIKIGTLTLFDCGFLTMMAILTLCFVIRFLIVDKKYKRIIGLFLFAIIIISFISYNIPNNYKNKIMVINNKDNMSILLCDENCNTGLIGLSEDYDKVCETLVDLKIDEIDFIVAYNYNLRHDEIINNLLDLNKDVKIFIPEKYLDNPNFKEFSNNFYSLKSLSSSEYLFNYHFSYDDTILGVDFIYNNKKYLIINDSLNIEEINQLFNQVSGKINCLIVKNFNYKFNEYYHDEIEMILYDTINEKIELNDTFKQVLSTQFFTIKT